MIKALRGTKDILPQDIQLWTLIESSARRIFNCYGYREIRTPIIEGSGLFIRSIGDTSDIVQKEMYIFNDRGGRSIALRPEATASIVRAYLENGLGHNDNITKLFYIGPMFRSERPQKGRQRQFHQLGIEAIGSDDPALDVEVISLAVKFLKELKIDNFELQINSLGCKKDKLIMIEKYKKALTPHLASLCEDCKNRVTKNVLRVLDCKNPDCSEIVKNIHTEQYLCKDCTQHFESVQSLLKKLGVSFKVERKMARGLDYYTKTIFELCLPSLGAKDAVCAGGRYNDLIEEMGGKSTPAIGFAFGIERMILSSKEFSPEREGSIDVFVATTSEGLYEQAFLLTSLLRDKGISSEIDYEKKSLKAQMKKAERYNASYVVIFGDEEFKHKKVVLRDMKARSQREVLKENIIAEILNLRG